MNSGRSRGTVACSSLSDSLPLKLEFSVDWMDSSTGPLLVLMTWNDVIWNDHLLWVKADVRPHCCLWFLFHYWELSGEEGNHIMTWVCTASAIGIWEEIEKCWCPLPFRKKTLCLSAVLNYTIISCQLRALATVRYGAFALLIWEGEWGWFWLATNFLLRSLEILLNIYFICCLPCGQFLKTFNFFLLWFL